MFSKDRKARLVCGGSGGYLLVWSWWLSGLSCLAESRVEAGGWQSAGKGRFSLFSSSVGVEEGVAVEPGGSRLSLALELAVVPRYLSRKADGCSAASSLQLFWAVMVLEVTSDWLEESRM